MTNEELAAYAKAGDRQALYDLWICVRRLAFKIARRYVPMLIRSGYTDADIEQECFLAYWMALDAFDPSEDTLFSSYLNYPIQKALRAALGIRSGKDLLPVPVSLDEPIGEDDEGETRADLLIDQAAQAAFENAEQQLYSKQLRAALDGCMTKIGERPAIAIRARYFEGKTLEQTGAMLGVSKGAAHIIEHQGLRQLQRFKKKLDPYRDFVISTKSYHGTGFHAWKYAGSVEERIVIQLDERLTN